mgnify:CR=1 FL=1
MKDLKGIIELKVSTLSDKVKKNVARLLPYIYADSLGKMKYVDIKGLDLGYLSKNFNGDNEELYLSYLIDAISLSENNGDTKSRVLNNSSMICASIINIPCEKFDSMAEIISSWVNIEVSEELEGFEKREEELKKDEEDENDRYFSESEDDFDYKENLDDVDNESKDSSESDNLDEKFLCDNIKSAFGKTINSSVDKVMKRYNLLYKSGYDLERPYGIVSDREGIIYVDSSKELKTRNNPDTDLDLITSLNLFDLFVKKINFIVSDSRSAKEISKDVIDGYSHNYGLIYFPYKMIEYVYGRNSSKDESRIYNYATIRKNGKTKGIGSNWNELSKKINEDIKLTIIEVIINYFLGVLNTGYDRDIILESFRNEKVLKNIENLIAYTVDSLSVCVLISSYKSIEGLPIVLRIKVCSPQNVLSNNIMSEIISKCFEGNSGGSNGYTMQSSLNSIDSRETRVYEYGHEFNHKLSNAMPLFAYKAYEKLREKGEKVSYKSLILGECNDGTILRNGTHGVDLNNSLFHYINAGSRSGKGVMTLNMLAAALLSNKAIFYLDNKPDMVSILAELSGGNDNGPLFFGLNGSNYVDDKQHQFVNQDSWINKANIPIESVTLFGEPSWSRYGDIFYIRAFTLVFGIILARGLDGGHGTIYDKNYNGEDGIYLVCDEVNVLQESFKLICQVLADKIPLQYKKFLSMSSYLKSVYKESISDDARKGSKLKYENAKRDFEEAFNAHKFYALSYLNTLSDSISYIHSKSLAGFLPRECECSDVVVIGQNLEQIPISNEVISSATSSGRLSGDGSGANGLGGTQIAKDVKGAKSIPFAHFVFNSADALIGYNSLHTEYLAQADKTSKAYGKLDLSANNFCYIPKFIINESMECTPGSQLTKGLANNDSSVYFKPYLILNSSDSAYTSQMYDRVRNAGISPNDVIKEYPNDSGNDINPCVGFPEYMKLMGVSDLSDRLRKSSDIANYVVGTVLGYIDDGSGRPLWLQYVTDLRPNWLLSVRDIACMCGGLINDANISKGEDNPITKEYNSYVKFLSEYPELGIIDNSLSSLGSFYTDENGEVQYNISGYESSDRRDFYAKDDGSNEELEETLSNDNFEKAVNGNDYYQDDEEIFNMFDEDTDYSSNFHNFGDRNSSNNDNTKEIDEKDLVILSLIKKLQENNIDVGDIGYNVRPVEGEKGVDCGYFKTDNKEEFNASEMENLNFGDNNEEIYAETFAELINIVTYKVLSSYGGYNRINSFRVVGGSIVINGTVFRSTVSDSCIGVLPLDIRRKINAGNLSDLFNYRELLNMNNLSVLEFDSLNFVYDTVSMELGYNNTIGVDSFFNDIKSLQELKIGFNKFTRQDYKSKIKENDIFSHRSKVTLYAGMCDKGLSKFTKKSWSFTKNMFSSRNHNIVTKTLGVIFGGAISAVAGTATLGAKVVKTVSHKVDVNKRVDNIGSNVKKGFSAFKEGLNSLFND